MTELPYIEAPAGSPDRYVLTKAVTFKWNNPPRWILDIFNRGHEVQQFCMLPGGYLRMACITLYCHITPGHFFSVSVAPDTWKTMGGSCLHDFLYQHVELIAKFYGISVRKALHIADHWFLANLRASDFLFSRTYFIGVRAFGYAFNRLFSSSK